MNPGTPFSLLLVAAGAILAWGVEDRVQALNLEAIGVILMAVGAIGLLMSLLFWSAIFDRSARAQRRAPDVYVENPPATTYVTRREVVQEPHVVTREPIDPGVDASGHRRA